jgi:hypothetical protein
LRELLSAAPHPSRSGIYSSRRYFSEELICSYSYSIR